ncbi:MAG: helix-turn-helix transcriptional regulator [Dysgonamonadaceae bacterium]|jgi:AraC-like DNA-binding protein|nr:helix-turn-helix transcriptional regulator [Dysgonamonadaceae bacterium]
MSILYLDEHKSCRNYLSDFNIGFKSISLPAGEVFTPDNRFYHCLLFMMSGEASLSYNARTFLLKKDTMCFIPISANCSFKAEEEISFIVNYFNRPVNLCEKEAIEGLSEYLDGAELNPVMRINTAMKLFLSSMNFYLQNGTACKHFYEVKHQELLFVLRYFYDKPSLAGFFKPIISNNFDFRNLVLENCSKAASVKELAALCKCSISSFSRMFNINFGENPYQWMQNRKMKHIIVKLANKNIPFIDIIDEFGFSSPGHFTTYCKRHLNKTPSKFRREH